MRLGWLVRCGLIGVGAVSCRPDDALRHAEERAAGEASLARPPAGGSHQQGESSVGAYPEVGWRRSTASELKCVVLWVSHILIRFEGGRNDSVNFDSSGGRSVLAPPPRSRADALALARHLASLAQRDPSRFGELARQHSEDLTTRDRGGSLG